MDEAEMLALLGHLEDWYIVFCIAFLVVLYQDDLRSFASTSTHVFGWPPVGGEYMWKAESSERFEMSPKSTVAMVVQDWELCMIENFAWSAIRNNTMENSRDSYLEQFVLKQFVLKQFVLELRVRPRSGTGGRWEGSSSSDQGM